MIETDSLELPRLSLSDQTSLSTDRFSDNGVEKNLHYVIKNNTYCVEIRLPSQVKQTFSTLTLEAEILYDSRPKPKDVFQVKATPFKYKGLVDSKNSRCSTLEFSVSVLSSQHEDMNFLVHIVCRDAGHRLVAEGYSEPMQCISKPDVLRKKRGVKTKKRTWNDRVTEALERLEEMQRTTLALVAQEPLEKSAVEKVCPETAAEKFERGFKTMLGAYNEMSPESRAVKIRKMAVSSTPSQQQTFSEMTDQFYAEGMTAGIGRALCRSGLSPAPVVPDVNITDSSSSIRADLLFGFDLPSDIDLGAATELAW